MSNRSNFWVQLPAIGLPALLAASLAIFGLLLPGRFWSVGAFESMAFQMPELGLLTLAMFLPFVSAGFNLAIIVTANITGIFMAWLWVNMVPSDAGTGLQIFWVALGLLGAMLIACLIGVLIGSLVAYVGVHPILTTLGFMTLIKGVGIFITRGAPVSGMPPVVQFLGTGSFLGVPMPMVVFILTALAMLVLMNRTSFGKYVYMSGSNINATYFSGIGTHRVIIGIYVISSLICVLAGLVMNARFNSARMGYGDSYLLLTVLAIIMGGADPLGGFGKVGGLVLALFVLQIISTGLNLFGVSQHVSLAMWGAVLIFVLAAKFFNRRYYLPWAQRRAAGPDSCSV
ncbi:MAG: ABC transporter permease [Planctomycetota bacterium]|jgi:simple sugar transport system permease protein|nr:ABC transporter permease [Planctomycetota bacterium]